jgi:hypothetical protein
LVVNSLITFGWMKFLKVLFRFYINSSLHVAFAVVSLAAVTALEFETPVKRELLFFIFFGTITGYNFVKYAPVAGLHHRSLAGSLRMIQLFSFICFAGLVYFSFKMPWVVWYFAAGLALLTLLYAIPLLKHRNLRTIPGLKIFVVAVVWSGVTVGLPLIEATHTLSMDVTIAFFQRIFIVIVLTIPFEIRDLNFDNPALGTIPQKIGYKRTRWLAVMLLFLVPVVELLKTETNLVQLVSLVFVCGLAGIAVWFSKREQPPFYASFWVEGIPILWLYALLVLRHFLVQPAF